jgi:serine/threonine protein kinase/tetratricopeptide (TPR) repeat protein
MTSAQSLPPFGAGTMLAGRYEVRRELGRGGMGIVYLCRDTFSGESVALKRLHRADAKTDPEDVWWFQQEARCLASLDHPTIVRARDFGILPDTSPFLVMDVAQGRSLLSWLELGAIPWPWPYTVLWSFIDQILAGLSHAHARGVIHGDLKPTNLMIDFPGPSSVPRVYILDLGLASLVRDPVDHRLDRMEGSPPVVRAGAGTPGWMAPEQIRRATPHYGPPTDLYAIGSILYHLLSGREPYTGTVEEILDGHRNQPLPDFVVPSNVPPEAGAFVRTLMAKRPWQRFEYAADARRDLERIRPPQPTETWAFRFQPSSGTVQEITSVEEAHSQRDSGPIEIATSSATALGLLGLRPSPLVARHEERAELRAVVEESVHPQGRGQKLLLLYGEAGVGKSRLAEWLCEDVHERGVMVPLRARYRKIPAPLDGIVGAVNSHFGLERADRNLVEKTLLNVWEIAKDDEDGNMLVAAAAEWLRPTPPGQVLPLGPTGKRFFFDTPEVRRKTLMRVLEKIGQRRPILLWLDDLHLGSARTFETLSKLRQELPMQRILLAATARSEAIAVDGEALARLEALRHLYSGRVIELRPLSAPDTEELLQSSLPLEEAAVKRATSRSRGNPLFALQLLHAWAASNRLQMSDGIYSVPPAALEEQPGSTTELWDERILAIPPELRRAAHAAAALGGDIPLICLRALLHSLDISVGPAIEALHRAQILIPSAPGRLRWPHNLLQEHLLSRQLERADAKAVFRRAADALALHPAAGTRRVVSHRVTNLLRAGDELAVAERVLEFVESNWRRVRDVGATLNDLSRLEGLVSGPATAAYARWRAEALRHVGRFAEAGDLADRARRAFASMGDVGNEAHCMRLLGHILATQSVAEGREHVAQALSKFDAVGDGAGRAECEVVLGEIDYFRGHHEAARTWLKQASRHFAKLPDPLGHGRCLLLLGMTDLAGGKRQRAQQMIDDAREQFEKVGYRLGMAECEMALAHLAHRGDEAAEALAHAERARKMMQDLKNPRGEAACQRLLSMIALDTSDLMRSREHALSASALYDQMSEPRGQVEASLLLAQVALATSNPVSGELIRACDAIGLIEAETCQHLALSKAWLAHTEGKVDEAMTELQTARLSFGDPRRTGDHARQLLARLSELTWPKPGRKLIDDWRADLGVSRKERKREAKALTEVDDA